MSTLDHDRISPAGTESCAPCPRGAVYWQPLKDRAGPGSIPGNYTDTQTCAAFPPLDREGNAAQFSPLRFVLSYNLLSYSLFRSSFQLPAFLDYSLIR